MKKGYLIATLCLFTLMTTMFTACEEDIAYTDLDYTVNEVEVTYHDTLLLDSETMEEEKRTSLIDAINDRLEDARIMSNVPVDGFCDAVRLMMRFKTESGDTFFISYTCTMQDGEKVPMGTFGVNGKKEGYVEGEVYYALEDILEKTGGLEW